MRRYEGVIKENNRNSSETRKYSDLVIIKENIRPRAILSKLLYTGTCS